MKHLLRIVLLFCYIFPSSSYSTSRKELESVIAKWTEAHNNRDYKLFKSLYGQTLLFYGRTVSNDECLQLTKKTFNKYKHFYLRIISEIRLSEYPGQMIKCEFDKSVTTEFKTKDYPSYLLLKKIGGEWKIIGESDLITDHNLNYHLEIGDSFQTIVADTDNGNTAKYNTPHSLDQNGRLLS